ncbi:MAG: hypothetical protein ACOX9E_15620 [Lentisphaeria bacterium]
MYPAFPRLCVPRRFFIRRWRRLSQIFSHAKTRRREGFLSADGADCRRFRRPVLPLRGNSRRREGFLSADVADYRRFRRPVLPLRGNSRRRICLIRPLICLIRLIRLIRPLIRLLIW